MNRLILISPDQGETLNQFFMVRKYRILGIETLIAVLVCFYFYLLLINKN